LSHFRFSPLFSPLFSLRWFSMPDIDYAIFHCIISLISIWYAFHFEIPDFRFLDIVSLAFFHCQLSLAWYCHWVIFIHYLHDRQDYFRRAFIFFFQPFTLFT
jgi:hypothetical protein